MSLVKNNPELEDWSADFDGTNTVNEDWSEDFGIKKQSATKSEKGFMSRIATQQGQMENITNMGMAAKGLSDAGRHGLITGATEIPALGMELFGGIALGGEEIGKNMQRSITPPSQRGIELTDYTKERLDQEGIEQPVQYESPNSNPVSTALFAGAEAIRKGGDYLKDEDYKSETIPERIVERGTEYAAMGAGFTQGLISIGKKTIAKEVKNPGLLQKMTMDMAKSPEKAHKIEQALSAVAATLGQGVEEMGGGAGYQMLAEIVGTVSAGTLVNMLKKFGKSNFYSRWKNKEHHAEIDVGEFFDSIFKEDPNIVPRIKEGQTLSKKHGIDMSLGELAENPELQAAEYALKGQTAGGQTALREKAKKNAKTINEMFVKPTGAVQVAQNEIAVDANKNIQRLKNAVMKSTDDAVDEALNVGNLKGVQTEDVGISVINSIDAAEDLARLELNPLYDGINLAQKTGSDRITSAIRAAKKSLLPKNEFRGELESHLSSIFDAVIGKTAKPKVLGTVKKIKLGGTEKAHDFTVGSIQEMQTQLKRVIREERMKGNSPLVRELNKVLSSTYDQLDSVSGANVDRLKSANAKAREIFERFEDARVKAITRVDLQNDLKVAPEDIVNTLVKSNKEKASMDSVHAYKDALSNNEIADKQLFNAFAIKLRNEASVQKTIRLPDGSERTVTMLDTKKVQKMMDTHSNFLRASGVNIKSPDAMAKRVAFAQDDLSTTLKEQARDALIKWSGSNTPVDDVMKAVKNNTIGQMFKHADPLVQRGIREAMWDGLFDASITAKTLSDGVADVSVSNVRKLLQKRSKTVLAVLGKKHYQSLNDIISIVDRVSVGSGRTTGIAGQKVDEHLVEKVLTGLRAAAHGFVRPDLIIAQATGRMAKAMNTKQAQALLIEALNNPDMAIKLASAAKDVRTRPVVMTMFTPILSAGVSKNRKEEEK